MQEKGKKNMYFFIDTLFIYARMYARESKKLRNLCAK
jgi:hypothetical protein